MKRFQLFQVSFGTKVLVPVAVILALMLALTVWVVNQRITRQFQTDAAHTLSTADAVFRSSQTIHTRNLLARFKSLSNEPRYRAAFQSGHLPTLRDQIKDIPSEQGVDVAIFSSVSAELLASAKRDPLISIADFEKASSAAVGRALHGEETVDTIRVGERLFDIVSIPMTGSTGDPIGAVTFASEIGQAVAQEFSLVTHGQIVLLAKGRVVVSTLPASESNEQLSHIFNQSAALAAPSPGPFEIVLADEHYFCAAGKFSTLTGDTGLGYLLLSSYEQPLRALRSTQQMLLGVSTLAILAGLGIIWWLVRKATEPLRHLRDSAEAVGRGDFSKRVEVSSRDECGELAHAFNQMTENVKESREELERTVETLKSTQAQLIQSEKLSGIGEFVAGVAHELNNPLTSVMGFSELLARADKDPQNRRYLEIIHKSALRCQKIVQGLLSFARRHQPERKLSNVNTLIENAVEFLQYQLRTSNIEVTTRLDPNLAKTMLDPHQIQQVFLNIINNARQAIEGCAIKGRIIISSERMQQSLRVTFQDNGPGISEENLPKLFNPFFTTKEVGKGTGLGLSLCYGIVKEHGGTIQVRSKLGEGATFIIELPLVEASAGLEEKPIVAETPLNPNEGAGKRVLVIDDEEPILEMVRAILLEHGYQVDVAQDGESGLRRLTQTRYDLALCDWKMPGLNGEQVYQRLQADHPELCDKLIFITGDVISQKVENFLTKYRRICLPKPFSLVDFRAAIDKALGTHEPC